VRLLLDTHALIWWLEGGARLCEQARAAIRSRANEVRVSPVSAVEISIKVAKGKLDAPGDLVAQMARHGFTALPVTTRVRGQSQRSVRPAAHRSGAVRGVHDRHR
jgi:PIN domain nuclease of toxin-antitoxin system